MLLLIDIYIHMYNGDAERWKTCRVGCDTAGGIKHLSIFVSADKEGPVIYFIIASILLHEATLIDGL